MTSDASNARFIALVPAAGSGNRLGGDRPKQYRELAGRPMLWHTLTRLASHPLIETVAVVLATDDGVFDSMDWRGVGGLRPVRCGGETRAHSVRNGLASLEDEVTADDWILVHDAARPCLSHEVIDRLVAALADDAVGGIAALPVADTLKRATSAGRIRETVPREGLWAAQTPQMFRYGLLASALAGPLDGITDEASAMEQAGHAPRLIEGDPANLKVTFERDLASAERWLAAHPHLAL